MKRFLLWLVLNRRERVALADGLHERYSAHLRKLDNPANRDLRNEIEVELAYTGRLIVRLFHGQ